MKISTYIALLFSFVSLLLGVIITVYKQKKDKKINFYALILTTFISVVFLKFPITYFAVKYCSEPIFDEPVGLNTIEIIIDTIIHSLQTFSMDENYTEYIIAAKTLGKQIGFRWPWLFGGYTAAVSLLAPAITCTVLFQIISQFFPEIKYHFSRKKERYFFSELNECSLYLAKSIVDKRKNEKKKAMIVFTDVYSDSSNENQSELIGKAKEINAICLKEDLSKIKFRKNKSNTLILIDEINDNADKMAFINDDKIIKSLGDFSLYVFYTDATQEVIFKNFSSEIYEKCDNKKNIDIRNINSRKNMIYSVLQSYPLYEPLLRKTENDNLSVSIVGSGKNGTEMFLNTYWCSQMIGVKNTINIASIESENDFTGKINGLCPELFESSREKSELLRIYDGEEIYSEPYFKFGYYCGDVFNCYVSDITFSNNLKLIDSDYFFICLGSDNKNIELAERIARKATMSGDRKTILYVVSNPEVAKSLNQTSKYKPSVVVAVSDLESVYSYDCVFNRKIEELAVEYDKKYNKLKNSNRNSEAEEKGFLKLQYDLYNNITRGIHLYYRAFSALKTSNKLKEISDKYKLEEYSDTQRPDYSIITEYLDLCEKDNFDEICNELAWLEHRRWNADLRSRGYSYNSKDQDHISLTHPCLVECNKSNKNNNCQKDKLDLVCEQKRTNYKDYDRPDFFEFVKIEEENRIIPNDKIKEIVENCDK